LPLRIKKEYGLYVNSEREKIYGKLAICGQILYIDIRDQSHS